MLGEYVGKRAALHEFHCDVIRGIHLTPVVYANDVGVIERRSRHCFTAKPFNEQGVLGVFRKQNLDCYWTIQQSIAGDEHLCHSATADATAQFVTRIDDDGFGHVPSPAAGFWAAITSRIEFT